MRQTSNENSYENYLKTSGYSLVTINIYTTYYNLFEQKEISQAWVDKFIRQHNNSVARSFLKSCLHDYLGWEDLKILKQRGKVKQRIPHWVTRKQYIQLIQDETMRKDVQLLIRILFESGLRIVEVVGDRFHKALTPSNFNLETNEINGIGKFNKEYIVYIKPKTSKIIKDMVQEYNLKPDEPLFTFQERRAQILIKKEGYRILGKNIHPHMLRSGLATYLLKLGYNLLEIKMILRHANLNTVERYANLERDDLLRKLKESGY